MLDAGASTLAWRWLLPAVPFVAIAARLVRGVWVIRAFEQQRRARRRSVRRARASPSCLCVADALHKPLVAFSTAAIALRLTFFSLAIGVGSRQNGGQSNASTVYYWLAQAPSVAYVALCAYLALLMLAIVYTGQWPSAGSRRSATKRRSSLVIAAAAGGCLVFCALLVAAITLLAITRNVSLSSGRPHRRHHYHLRLVNDQDDGSLAEELHGLARAALLYLAFIWSVLGLLLLCAQAKATRVLLGYELDSLPQRRAPDPDKTIPTVFVVKLSRGAISLSLLLLVRGVYSVAVALLCDSAQLARWFFLAQGGRWSEFWAVIVLDLCWELLALLAVVSLLKTMPLAVYSWPSPALRARTATTEPTAETDATDPTDESDETDEVDETKLLLPSSSPSSSSSSTPVVGFRFQLPTLHELVQDYVIVTRQSLTRRLARADDVIFTYAHGEPERCVHEEPSSASPGADVPTTETPAVAGSEFMECQCPQRRRQQPGGVLPDAQVPLLSDEEIAEESFEVIDALSDTHSDDSQVLSASS